jgi:phospholipase C
MFTLRVLPFRCLCSSLLLFALFSVSRVRAQSLTNGLVFYAPFTSNLNDVQGGRAATSAGAAVLVTSGGVSGGFLRLTNSASGAEQYVYYSDPTPTTGDFSFQCWVRSFDPQNGQPAGDPAIVANKDWDSGGNVGWVLAREIDSSNLDKFQWNLNTSGGTRADLDPLGNAGASVFDGTWHQILVSHQRSGNAVFYRDGVAVASVSIAADSGQSVRPALGTWITNNILALGEDASLRYDHATGTGVTSFNGDLDEPAMWSRALSAGDALLAYIKGTNGLSLSSTLPPSFVQQPQGGTKFVGDSFLFSCTVVADPPPSFQWYKSGVKVNGATNNQLLLTNLALTDAGNYLAVASVAGINATSAPASLVVQTNSGNTGTISDVRHVVIFIQENRSFDEYFGSLKGVRGFGDRNALVFQNGNTDYYQPNGASYLLPYHTTNQCVNDVGHGWSDGHSAWDSGKWDQWVPAKGTIALSLHNRADLAYYYGLAEAYTICDDYFCSVLGPTNPNRLYSMTGMIDPNGTGGGPAIDNSEPGYTWTTYPERLQAAGVSWRVYQESDNFDDNALAWFNQYRTAGPGNPLYDRGIAPVSDLVGAFRTDVTNGTLPQVSWLIAPTAESEHPIYSPSSGAAFTKQLLDALAANPSIYNSTVFILTYDENGGFFDHIVSPVPAPGTPDEFVGGLPIGLGVRVPTIVVSPWSRGGYVCSQVFDHTSLIRFLETWTGVTEPNISAWRRMVCGDMTSAFDFAHPDYTFPTLPTVSPIDCPSGVTPSLPTPQTFPVQENGVSQARLLPYQLNANSDTDCGGGHFLIMLTNAGTAAGHAALYPNAFRTDGPWQFDVIPGATVTNSADVSQFAGGRYDLTCYGPNGFQRRFAGNFTNACNQIEATSRLDPAAASIAITMRNSSGSSVGFTITANAYQAGGPWNYPVSAASSVTATFDVGAYNGWYDLSVTAASDATFLRRLAGHIETNFSVAAAPLITLQPSGQAVDAGTKVTFNVSAINGPLTYQWQFGGTNLSGATASSYTIANASPSNAGTYRVTVSNTNGATLSSPALLTVNTTPQISGQFIGEIADAGTDFVIAPPTTGARPLTHRWYRNGVLISTSLTNILELANAQIADSGNYQLIASNSFGAATSSVASVKFYAGPIVSNLVAHLPFDNNFLDTSGRGNNAAYSTNGPGAGAAPTFVAGKIGQAFQYTTLSDGTRFEYATLGYPADLKFGTSNDFSVSCWVNYTNQSDDLPFISEKDWAASANQGWGIFTQSGGNARVNFTGPNHNTDKFDTTQTPVIRDGTWHHLVVSVLRAVPPQAAYVYIYVDGVLVNKSPMSLAGTIDTDALPFSYASPKSTWQTTWALNIGQDGTGVYYDMGNAYNIGAKVDDLGIWRRALTAKESKAIFDAGGVGKDLSYAVVPTLLNFTVSGNLLHLSWSGSPRIKLQRTSNLSPATWVDVPSTLGASAADVPMTNSAAFFKLAQ